jgi:hypothetical protein
MCDIFACVSLEQPTIKQSEFNELVKKVLTNISNAYTSSWHSRLLKDEEFPDESICDKCKGCGEFKDINGAVLECKQHYSEDDSYCYHRYMDAEEFGLEVESEIENIENLLFSAIVAD